MTYALRAEIALAGKPQESMHIEPCSDGYEAMRIFAALRDIFPLNRIKVLTPRVHGSWAVGIVKV